MAGGDIALRFPIEGVEDEFETGALSVTERDVNENDTIVGISASGRTPFVKGALLRSKLRGATTVAVVNNRSSELAGIASITIAPIVGAEILTGSTRLKAGTSQKMVLNMLTTCAMIEIGKTYGNLMVDMQATNLKLADRAIRIIQQVTGASTEAAAAAFEEEYQDCIRDDCSKRSRRRRQRAPGCRWRILKAGAWIVEG
jgi:N-acetylmuramic acid 6-phosphate etherase